MSKTIPDVSISDVTPSGDAGDFAKLELERTLATIVNNSMAQGKKKLKDRESLENIIAALKVGENPK